MRFAIARLLLLLVAPGLASAQAHPATDVSFDDTSTTYVSGAQVQQALQSADSTLAGHAAELTDLASAVLDITDVDDDASVVHLREDCTNFRNCFESMSDLSDPTTGWIWNTRTPSASAPLVVEVAPGTFGTFECIGGSHITVRGSGRTLSILSGVSGARIEDCDQLEFVDLGFHLSSGGRYAVSWKGGGSSVWSNVEMVAVGQTGAGYPAGWWDECPGGGVSGSHYFHGSRILAENGDSLYAAAYGILSSCDGTEVWFYGGDILATTDRSTGRAVAARVNPGGDIRIFGSTVRVASIGTDSGQDLYGLWNEGGNLHVHGSIVNATASAAASDHSLHGINGRGGLTHTPGTAFNLVGNGGLVRRVLQRPVATVVSPFMWGASDHPPVASTETNVLTSKIGQDTYIEKDCSSLGDCDGGGNEAHLMIYNNKACSSANPWFNVVTGSCRQ